MSIRKAVLFLVLLLAAQTAVAQELSPEPPYLEQVTIDLWPDYDRPQLLVLETALLPSEAPLPATVRLPLPEGAELNAVAFQDQQQLINILDYRISGEEIILTTPGQAVRLEYYVPFAQERSETRAIDFTWQPRYDVVRFDLSIQEPRASTEFELSPGGERIVQTDTGIRYHQYPTQQIDSGEAVRVAINYVLPGGQLTAGAPSPSLPAAPAAVAAPAANNLLDNLLANWPWLVLAGGLLIAAIFFIGQGLGERRAQQNRPRKPQRRSSPPTGAKGVGEKGVFCTQCGTAARPEDQFCRSCGTALRR